MKIECEAILFDLDGVLIDSTDSVVRHWRQWAEQHGLDLDEIMRIAHGRRTVETMRLVAPHLPAEEEARRFADIDAADTRGVTTIDGASDLLNFLPSGAWAIVTSGTRRVATARLVSRGLPVPPIMVTAEDVVRGKPDPEPYLAGAQRLGFPAAECLVVEDSPAGVAAALAAGMRAVGVASTHASHDLAGATVVARRLKDIRVTRPADSRFVVSVAAADPG